MTLSNAALRILRQLIDLIDQIRPPDFARPSVTLGGATIGQHVRHTLEFFSCFEAGFKTGMVNYDKRKHDRLIETDKSLALAFAESMIAFVSQLDLEKNLQLQVGYDPVKEEYITVNTNSDRELVYNIEHAVHHIAIIKIGLTEVAPYVVLEDSSGIAASTTRHGRNGNPMTASVKGDFPA